MSETTTAQPARRSRAPRTAAVVVGSIVGLLALALLAAGGVLLWGNSEKDQDGYLASGAERFSTPTYALATDDLDVDTDAPGWLVNTDIFSKVRLQAQSNDGKPIFVGVARTRDVEAYLRGSEHATVTDISYSPFRVQSHAVGGSRRPVSPTDQRFWVASTQGRGTQTLRWNVKDGDWAVVVMNADGSRGVDAAISVGATVPFLAAAGWGTVGGGAVLLIAAGLLMAFGLRSSARPPTTPSGPTPAVA